MAFQEEGLTTNWLNQGISRRGLLKLGVGLVASAAVLPTEHEVEPIPSGLDILSTEELQAAHIQLYDTPDVSVYLRRSALDIPLFQDAQAGKIDKVSVVLVDNNRLSWNSSRSMPEDARLVYQATTPHPSDQPEAYWQKKIDYKNSLLSYRQNSLARNQAELAAITSGNRLREYQQYLDLAKSNYHSGFGSREQIEYWVSQIAWLPQEGINLHRQIDQDRESIGETQQDLDVLSDRPRAIEEEAQNSTVLGRFIHTAEELQEHLYEDTPATFNLCRDLKEKRPDLRNQVFVFVAVAGEDTRPTLKQSYVRPSWFQEDPYSEAKREGYRYIAPNDPGITVRHEVRHYNPIQYSTNEYGTDTLMYEDVRKAWEAKQQGDDSQYWIVFKNRNQRGVVITKDRNSSPQKTSSL